MTESVQMIPPTGRLRMMPSFRPLVRVFGWNHVHTSFPRIMQPWAINGTNLGSTTLLASSAYLRYGLNLPERTRPGQNTDMKFVGDRHVEKIENDVSQFGAGLEGIVVVEHAWCLGLSKVETWRCLGFADQGHGFDCIFHRLSSFRERSCLFLSLTV